MPPLIRPARAGDGRSLSELDAAAWEPLSSPVPRPQPEAAFFNAEKTPDCFFVAEDARAVVGYVAVGPALPFESTAHWVEIQGLAVAPAWRGEGIGRQLLEASISAARDRGARKLTLRVFAPNTVARALYESCGFEVEGILRDAFLIGGTYVDDVLMALRLGY